jgi:hypothetical protein
MAQAMPPAEAKALGELDESEIYLN